MTLQQLEYVLAIAQEGSITKAAHKLYKAQPNISNAIQELEAELHVSIFERSPKGVLVTPEGEEFILRANDIIQQTKQLREYFGHRGENSLTMEISVARSSYMATAVSEWINIYGRNHDKLQIHFKETNTNNVIESVTSGQVDLGVIRISADYQALYDMKLESRRLVQKTLMEFPMRIILKKEHPLAVYQDIPYEQLAEYTEIIHGDDQFPIIKQAHINKNITTLESQNVQKSRRVYVYDRGSQILLLDKIEGSYMWVSPIPLDMLVPFHMILKDCSFAKNRNKDIIIVRYDRINNPHIQNCMQYLLKFAANLQYEVEHRIER